MVVASAKNHLIFPTKTGKQNRKPAPPDPPPILRAVERFKRVRLGAGIGEPLESAPWPVSVDFFGGLRWILTPDQRF